MRVFNERERIAEMSATAAIDSLPSYTKLLSRGDRDSNIQFILREVPLALANYGFSTLRELVDMEITATPKGKALYGKLTPDLREEFWRKVDFIQSLLDKKK